MRFWTTITLILVSSAVGLTYEIAAGRVMAPFFGTSLLTWTAVIAVVLAGFSLGNALGGLAAEGDRRGAIAKARKALAGTAALMAISPAVLAILHGSGARGTAGMLFTVVVAFFPASTLISFPSPLLAKLAIEARPGREASSLGFVLAAGSVGAIVGAILAGFVTLPLIGSAATFAVSGAAALLCIPFVRDTTPRPEDETAPATLHSVAAVGAAALLLATSLMIGPVCRYESGMSCLDVVNRGTSVHLYADRTEQAAEREPLVAEDDAPRLVLPYSEWVWDRMDRDLGPAPSVLFIGGGGYTLPTKLLAARPEARATVVEIDSLVTQVVRRHMPKAGEMIERTGYADGHDAASGDGRLGIVHEDGRVYINQTQRRFDAVVMDAFSSSSVPAHLATLETYERLRDIVDGPVYVNLIDAPDGRLARGLHAILARLYPHVEAVQGPVSGRGRANILLAAAPQALAPLNTLPEDYAPTSITAARAFTDDRGWVGHR